MYTDNDDWVFVEEDEEHSYYYNKTRLEIDKESNHIKVWVNLDIPKNRNGSVTVKFLNNLLYLFDYTKMSYDILSYGNFYNSNYIESKDNKSDNQCIHIPSGSMTDIILNKILQDNNIINK